MPKAEIKAQFKNNQLRLSNRQMFILLDLQGIERNVLGYFNTQQLFGKNQVKRREEELKQSDQKVKSDLITITQWIMEDNLDLESVLRRYSNYRNGITAKKNCTILNHILTEQSSGYISSQQEVVVKPLKFKLLFFLLPALQQAQREQRRERGCTGGIQPRIQEMIRQPYPPREEPLKPKIKDERKKNFTQQQILNGFKFKVCQIFRRLGEHVFTRNMSFIGFTRSLQGMHLFLNLRRLLVSINFPHKEEDLDTIYSFLRTSQDNGPYSLKALKAVFLKEVPKFFISERVQKSHDAKLIMMSWDSKTNSLMKKLAKHLRVKEMSPTTAIFIMNQKAEGEGYVDKLIDRQVFLKGLEAVGFKKGSKKAKSELFDRLHLLNSSAIHEFTFRCFCQAASEKDTTDQANVGLEDSSNSAQNIVNNRCREVVNQLSGKELQKYINYLIQEGILEDTEKKEQRIEREEVKGGKEFKYGIKEQGDLQRESMVVCAICLENLKSVDTIVLKCSHKFHEDCIDSWKQKANEERGGQATCPSCRANL